MLEAQLPRSMMACGVVMPLGMIIIALAARRARGGF